MKQFRIIILVLIIFSVTFLFAEQAARPLLRRGVDSSTITSLETPAPIRERNLIPPGNLTAAVVDVVNVQLNWTEPTDLIHIFYHDGNPVDAYFQIFTEGYGTVFNLIDYPDATLEFLDFRHSPWGLNGTWPYQILIIDWNEETLLHSIDDLTTTINNGWELDIPLGSITAAERVGIFIVPLGNTSDDAYPVLDTDMQMNGFSYIINAADFSVVETSEGDFLMDLWIRDDGGPARRVTAESAPEPLREKNTPKLVRQDLLGYNVYRNDDLIAQISNPLTLSYYDAGLDDGSYTYYVTAEYDEGESDPSNSATVSINTGIQVLWSDSFENYPDFAFTFFPWTLIDLDQSATYGFNNVDFPGEYQPMAFIIFNPSQTEPPMTDVTPYHGQKIVASFSSTTVQNNDWMITPLIELGVESSVVFHARSYTAQYGLERFRVAISTTDNDPGSFSIISPGSYESAPVTWTEYSYDLSAYDGQTVYIAINCVSNNAFVFFLDNFKILSVGGSDADEMINESPAKLSSRNYPNPFNPETTIEFQLKQSSYTKLEIFNIRGQKIITLLNEYLLPGDHRVNWSGKDQDNNEVTSGLYLYRITTEDTILSGKMMLLK